MIDRTGLLATWRVSFMQPEVRGSQTHKFQAEDAAHALEQMLDAEPDARITSVVREDEFTAHFDGKDRLVLAEGESIWLTARNLSILIFDHGSALTTQAFPTGREARDPLASMDLDFVHEAIKVTGHEDMSAEELREQCGDIEPLHLERHLAVIDDEDFVDAVREAVKQG